MTRSAQARPLLAAVLATLLVGCGGNAPPPDPGMDRSIAPDLRGRRVILLPVQRVAGVVGNPDAELAYALTDRGREVDWVLEAELLAALERNPALQTRTRDLPVGIFLQAEVERVGDPLYGQLRRMASLVDAEVVLLPVMASWEANAAIPGSSPSVRFTVVLLDARTGRVAWSGVEEGDVYPRDDPRGLASAAEQIARVLLWYVRPTGS